MIKKPLGFVALVLIVGYTDGKITTEKKDSTLIATKNWQIAYHDGRIKKLEIKTDSLHKVISNFDCAKETEKWNRLFQNLQASMMTKKADAERSLEVERRRTAEINKTLKSL